MDWSKSKNIILAVLIVTNIFLLAVYGRQHLAGSQTPEQDVQQYTMNVLEDNNIYYKGEIYSREKKMHPLTVSYGKYDTNMVAGAMEKTHGVSSVGRTEEGYRNAADAFLKKCGFQRDHVVYAGTVISGSSAVVSYDNQYEGIPVEECYMTVTFRDGRIVDFQRRWMDVVSEGDSRLEVMSQLSALLKFMTETDHTSPVTITDMYLTYWIDSYDIDGDVLYDTALPAWCFVYNNGQKKYISATVQ